MTTLKVTSSVGKKTDKAHERHEDTPAVSLCVARSVRVLFLAVAANSLTGRTGVGHFLSVSGALHRSSGKLCGLACSYRRDLGGHFVSVAGALHCPTERCVV